jgi:hypothetical protein
VRREIELALFRGMPGIPVLPEGARMPETQDHPLSIQDFASCEAVVLNSDCWGAGTTVLVAVLASQYGIHSGRPGLSPLSFR